MHETLCYLLATTKQACRKLEDKSILHLERFMLMLATCLRFTAEEKC